MTAEINVSAEIRQAACLSSCEISSVLTMEEPSLRITYYGHGEVLVVDKEDDPPTVSLQICFNGTKN